MAGFNITELEAVNIILASADMMPVTQITSPTTSEAVLALGQLDNASAEIQAEGWNFNTTYDVELPLDGSSKCPTPDSSIRVIPTDNPAYIQKNDFIYDRSEATYVFKAPVRATVVYINDWTELNYEVQNYITKKAARRFHEYHVGSSDALRSLVQDEQEARRLILEAETHSGRYSMFDAPDMHAGLSYGNSLVGRASFNGADPFYTRDH